MQSNTEIFIGNSIVNCVKKRRHNTREAAIKFAKHYADNYGGDTLYPYSCELCGCYHLGHNAVAETLAAEKAEWLKQKKEKEEQEKARKEANKIFDKEQRKKAAQLFLDEKSRNNPKNELKAVCYSVCRVKHHGWCVKSWFNKTSGAAFADIKDCSTAEEAEKKFLEVFQNSELKDRKLKNMSAETKYNTHVDKVMDSYPVKEENYDWALDMLFANNRQLS